MGYGGFHGTPLQMKNENKCVFTVGGYLTFLYSSLSGEERGGTVKTAKPPSFGISGGGATVKTTKNPCPPDPRGPAENHQRHACPPARRNRQSGFTSPHKCYSITKPQRGVPLITCHDIFNMACAERAKYPLTSDRQKLQEAQDTLEGWQDLVTTVALRIQAGGKFGLEENLDPCMADERETYLEGLPEKLAHLIGYNIIPAIAALEGDGVTKAEVQRLLNRAETVAQRLIADCEVVRLRLNDGIKHEYEAMKRGTTCLVGLLDAASPLCAQ